MQYRLLFWVFLANAASAHAIDLKGLLRACGIHLRSSSPSHTVNPFAPLSTRYPELARYEDKFNAGVELRVESTDEAEVAATKALANQMVPDTQPTLLFQGIEQLDDPKLNAWKVAEANLISWGGLNRKLILANRASTGDIHYTDLGDGYVIRNQQADSGIWTKPKTVKKIKLQEAIAEIKELIGKLEMPNKSIQTVLSLKPNLRSRFETAPKANVPRGNEIFTHEPERYRYSPERGVEVFAHSVIEGNVGNVVTGPLDNYWVYRPEGTYHIYTVADQSRHKNYRVDGPQKGESQVFESEERFASFFGELLAP